jgi:hypothetical protein
MVMDPDSLFLGVVNVAVAVVVVAVVAGGSSSGVPCASSLGGTYVL